MDKRKQPSNSSANESTLHGGLSRRAFIQSPALATAGAALITEDAYAGQEIVPHAPYICFAYNGSLNGSAGYDRQAGEATHTSSFIYRGRVWY